MTEAEFKKLQAELIAELKADDVVLDSEGVKTLEEQLDRTGGNNYFSVGIHEVEIAKVELRKFPSGSRAIVITVSDGTAEAETFHWLSEKALPYTIDRIGKILIHNTKEENKETLRTALKKINSASKLFESISSEKKPITGFKCWLRVQESETQTYTDKNGVERPSIERDIFGYEPKMNKQSQVKEMLESGETKSDIDLDDIPF